MSESTSPNVDALLDHLDHRAGDGLRTVVTYDGEDSTIHYVRDDLDEDAVRATVDETHGNIGRNRSSSDYLDRQLGPRRASVQLRDRGVVYHLTPEGERRGALVTFDPDVARRLDLFARECLSILYG